MQEKPYATYALLGINVVTFLFLNNLLPAGNLLSERLPLYFPLNEQFGIWQFVSHMFVHANFTHLFFNMFGLFSFGSLLERIWGMKRFLIFYFAVGIGAGLIYSAVNYFTYEQDRSYLLENGVTQNALSLLNQTDDIRIFAYKIAEEAPVVFEADEGKRVVDFFFLFKRPVVGASGAIYGILVAFGLLFPNAKLSLIFLPIPIAAKYFIPVLLLLDFFSGVTGFSIFGGGIAHFAHLGGALIGFLLMLLWNGPNLSSVFRGNTAIKRSYK